MYLVKLSGKNEWWSAPTMSDIQHLSAKISIDTGELVMYDEVDELPRESGHADVSYMGNVHMYDLERVTDEVHLPDPNADYQRKYRSKMADQGKRLLRVYVPIEYYDECYKFCKEMSDD